MPGFIKKIKDEAAKTKAEKQLVYPGNDKTSSPTAIIARRKLVKQWKLSDLSKSLDDSTAKFDYKSGKEMFAAAACVQCHRMGIEGAAIGPDLTFLANRFSRMNILESILEPSKIVSEKYQNMKVVTREGETFVGRVDLSGDYRSPILNLIVNPLDPNQVTKIKKIDIIEHRASPISSMPTGLLNTLSKQEILNLIVYLESGGRSDHPLYKQ